MRTEPPPQPHEISFDDNSDDMDVYTAVELVQPQHYNKNENENNDNDAANNDMEMLFLHRRANQEDDEQHQQQQAFLEHVYYGVDPDNDNNNNQPPSLRWSLTRWFSWLLLGSLLGCSINALRSGLELEQPFSSHKHGRCPYCDNHNASFAWQTCAQNVVGMMLASVLCGLWAYLCLVCHAQRQQRRRRQSGAPTHANPEPRAAALVLGTTVVCNAILAYSMELGMLENGNNNDRWFVAALLGLGSLTVWVGMMVWVVQPVFFSSFDENGPQRRRGTRLPLAMV